MNAAELQVIEPSFELYNTIENFQRLAAGVSAWSSDHYTLNEETTWRIVFNRFKKAGAIKPNPSWRAPLPAGFELLVTQQMTPTELRNRLSNDPQFAALYGRWAAGEHEENWRPPQEHRLTATEWRSMPPHVAAAKMRDENFKRQVEALAASGEI